MAFLLLLTVILPFTMASQNGKAKEEVQLGPWQPPHYPYSLLTCTCGVQGPQDHVLDMLRQWASAYYRASTSSNVCQGHACYRADFVGVGYAWHGQWGNHYSVLGCIDPNGLGQGGFEYKFQQNISLQYFLSNHYSHSRDSVARQVLELACTHPLCQYMPSQPWGPDQYHDRLYQVAHASGASRVACGIGTTAMAMVSYVLAKSIV